jgi:hypothetical protein
MIENDHDSQAPEVFTTGYAFQVWYSFLIPLAALSLFLLIWASGEEPFFGNFPLWDATVALAGGMFGIVLWLGWGTFAVLRMAAIQRSLIAILVVIAAILVSVISVTINSYIIFGYISDRSVWLDGQKKASAITEKRNREGVGR